MKYKFSGGVVQGGPGGFRGASDNLKIVPKGQFSNFLELKFFGISDISDISKNSAYQSYVFI